MGSISLICKYFFNSKCLLENMDQDIKKEKEGRNQLNPHKKSIDKLSGFTLFSFFLLLSKAKIPNLFII